MSISESFSLAFKSIRCNKMRSFLTMLGIIIGVSAVFIIAGLGNGMKNYMIHNFQNMGSNNLNVRIMTSYNSPRTVSTDDLYNFVNNNANYFGEISPTVSFSGPAKYKDITAKNTQITGVGESFLAIKKSSIAKGRGIMFLDIKNRDKVCVIGSYTSNLLFNGNSLGKNIQVGEHNFTIIGVLQQSSKKAEAGGSDDIILIPYSTAARLSKTNVSNYTITVVNQQQAAYSKKLLEDKLYEQLGSNKLFDVSNMAMFLDSMNNIINMMVAVLTFIAAISLVVGGIGIMNIMLVSVTERTREIGIRKSLGAKEKYILQQFVIEAGTTSGIGGVLGIIFGYAVSMLITYILTQTMGSSISVIPNPGSVLLSFSISVAIGIFFGYLPAKKAASLNPIDALHYN